MNSNGLLIDICVKFHNSNYTLLCFSAQFDSDGTRIEPPCKWYFVSTNLTSSKSGKFFSHKYPQNYPPESNCQYIFRGMKHEKVMVTFNNIQLQTIDGS